MKYENIDKKERIFSDNTFLIRLAVAGTFLILVIFFDLTNRTFHGITPDNIYQAIAFDFGQVIELFVGTSGNI